jgi:hypothetical protein
LQEEIFVLVKEEPNPIVARQKRTKKGPAIVTPSVETPKGRGRKKDMIPEETP